MGTCTLPYINSLAPIVQAYYILLECNILLSFYQLCSNKDNRSENNQIIYFIFNYFNSVAKQVLFTGSVHYVYHSLVIVLIQTNSKVYWLFYHQCKNFFFFQYTIFKYWNIKFSFLHSNRKCDRVWSRIVISTFSCGKLDQFMT